MVGAQCMVCAIAGEHLFHILVLTSTFSKDILVMFTEKEQRKFSKFDCLGKFNVAQRMSGGFGDF